MQLGFNLPISGPTSAPRSFTRIAQEGEALGYDYLTSTDHVVLPAAMRDIRSAPTTGICSTRCHGWRRAPRGCAS